MVGLDVEPHPLSPYDRMIRGRLLDPLEGVLESEEIDVFVHCAYHAGRGEYDINVNGTILWAEQALKKGVPRQVFVSSISARRDAFSVYGKLKYDTERWFLEHGQVVVRLGLVVGNGGFFQNMVEMIRKWPVLPLLDRGKSRVYYVGIEDVVRVISGFVEARELQKGALIWNLFQPEPAAMRDVLEAIKKAYGYSCAFVPIPYRVVLATVVFLEKVPFLRVKMNSNNVRGLKQNDSLDLKSHFAELGCQPSRLETLIKLSRKDPLLPLGKRSDIKRAT